MQTNSKAKTNTSPTVQQPGPCEYFLQRLGIIQKPEHKLKTCKSRRCSSCSINFLLVPSKSSCKSESLRWESLDLDLSGLFDL